MIKQFNIDYDAISREYRGNIEEIENFHSKINSFHRNSVDFETFLKAFRGSSKKK